MRNHRDLGVGNGFWRGLWRAITGVREEVYLRPYAVLAAQLGKSEGALKVAVCRLRERYRERLKEEIGHTVASPSEVDGELRHLFRVLARG